MASNPRVDVVDDSIPDDSIQTRIDGSQVPVAPEDIPADARVRRQELLDPTSVTGPGETSLDRNEVSSDPFTNDVSGYTVGGNDLDVDSIGTIDESPGRNDNSDLER